MKRLLLYNTIILAIFCGLWYSGFYISERWMHIIDLGAPWSWLATLFAISYGVSFLSLRERSQAVAMSFVGPVITAPAFWLWVMFCAIKFDPFY
jgi:ABC-type multidrug transport system permease subunit